MIVGTRLSVPGPIYRVVGLGSVFLLLPVLSTAFACEAGSGGPGRAVQMTSICVSLAPGRERELVVQSGQTQMALLQLSHADITSFFVAV